MGLDGGNTIECRLIMLQANELCYTNWEYAPTGSNTALTLANCLNAIWEHIEDPLTAVLSVNCQIVSLNGRLRGTPNAGQTYSLPINNNGDIAGDVMPAYITYSFQKFPDNDTRFQIGTHPDFDKGRFNLAGVPEAAQSNGVLASGYATLLGDLAAAVKTIPADTVLWDTPELGMTMVRYASGVFQTRAWVEDLSFGRIGTQLTRKS